MIVRFSRPTTGREHTSPRRKGDGSRLLFLSMTARLYPEQSALQDTIHVL